MTELGIRQVDGELVEAAEAFGTTSRNTLLRVQLPLALPTIMAGINQVIMLGLSMVVIAGMVGGGGLGGSVYRAIGNVDVGLGFEAGVSIVILAMYLDRMTGALGREVSPLGRRALAKAQSRDRRTEDLEPPAAARRRGRRRRRPGPRRRRHGHVRRRRSPETGTVTDAANIGKGKKISMGYIPWDEGIASTFLWKELLEQRGFEVDVKQYEAGALYTGHGGRPDRLPDRLLAAGHPRHVLGEVPGQLEDMGSWYGPTSLELAVPSYVKGVDSLDDLKGKASDVQGPDHRHRAERRRDGPAQGQGPARRTASTRSTRSSTARRPAMLAELKRAYDKKEPIVVPLWSPHWAYNHVRPHQAQGPQERSGARATASTP